MAKRVHLKVEIITTDDVHGTAAIDRFVQAVRDALDVGTEDSNFVDAAGASLYKTSVVFEDIENVELEGERWKP